MSMNKRVDAWQHSDFETARQGDLPVVRAQGLGHIPGLVQGFTTRAGGITPPPHDTLSFNWTRCTHPKYVSDSFARLATALGITTQDMVVVRCEHGTQVHVATPADGGRGTEGWACAPDTDGLITDQKGLALVTLHADCMPIFFYDPLCPAIGLCHAGWRGVVDGMAASVVRALHQTYGSQPANLRAAIGPHIGPCCFEVDAPVIQRFQQASDAPDILYPQQGGKAHIDMQRTVQLQLLALGLLPENIEVASLCTACDSQTFFSYRRDKGVTGSMAGYMMLV